MYFLKDLEGRDGHKWPICAFVVLVLVELSLHSKVLSLKFKVFWLVLCTNMQLYCRKMPIFGEGAFQYLLSLALVIKQ